MSVATRLPGRQRLRWWHQPETLVCGIRGHVVPVADGRTSDAEHAGIVTMTSDGRRLGRCLRCDAWIDAPIDAASRDTVEPLDRLAIPRRGQPLREAMVVRLIAIERAAHAVAFTLAAIGLWVIELQLPGLQGTARQLTGGAGHAGNSLAGPGQVASRDVITRQLERILSLRRGTLGLLAGVSAAYAVVEGIEAVGLWFERRWAEYLTALATAGFLPFEIYELTRRVTVVRLGALVINLAVLIWLVWRKHLFGLGRPPAEVADRLAPFRLDARRQQGQ